MNKTICLSDEHHPLAEIPTVKLGTVDRAIAKVLNVQLPEAPENQGQHDLMADCFTSLHKPEPHVVDEEICHPGRLVNRALMDWVMESEAWDTSHKMCSNNPAVAAGSTIATYAALLSDEAIREALKRQEEADQKQQEAEDKFNNAKSDKEFEDALQALQDAQEAGEKAKEFVESLRNDPIKGHAAEAAAESGKEAGGKVDAVMKSWGLESGEVQPTDVNTILNIASQDRFKSLSEMLGRLQGIASSTVSDVKAQSTSAVSNVDLTEEVEQVFMDELMWLSPQAPVTTRAEQLDQMLNGGLLGWLPVNSQQNGGSFLMYLDTSGSMSEADVNAEKALALGIARALQDDDPERTYRIIDFESKLHLPGVCRDDDWKTHINWALNRVSGGTNFVNVFEHAVNEITDMAERGIKSTDVVFVTDGIAPLPETTIQKWMELKTRISTRLIYLRVDSPWGGMGGHDPVADIADVKYLGITANEIFTDCEKLCVEIARSIAEHAYNGNGG